MFFNQSIKLIFFKSEIETHVKQLLELKAEHSYLQNLRNSNVCLLIFFCCCFIEANSFKNEPTAQILHAIFTQLGNFNKRIVTIEEGFLKTAKTIVVYEQAQEILNRNLATSLPMIPPMVPQFQMQQNLFNEFLNVESKKPICLKRFYFF